MQTNNNICEDKELNGVCTKGKDCPVCGKAPTNEEQQQQQQSKEENLNVGAKEFVPKKKKQSEPLKFNMEAKPYIPKAKEENDDLNDEEREMLEDEANQDEIDMIMNDVVENDMMEELADSEDEDKWYPKYKDCECCQGFVFKCQGKVCQSLGLCYCKMKDDCDD
jgi:hypothetical protein